VGVPATGTPGHGTGKLDAVFERFTDQARRVLVLAQEEARLLKHGFVGTEHILLGILHEGEGVAAHALGSCGVSLDAVREQVAELAGATEERREKGQPPWTPRAKKVLELSLREALQLRPSDSETEQVYIGTEHPAPFVTRQLSALAGYNSRISARRISPARTAIMVKTRAARQFPR
jgi:ATP-dependent Clp protease ATP-binding subunit ClpC